MKVKLTFHGDEIKGRLSKRGKRKALAKGAEHLLAESNRTVPHEWGDLERSGGTRVDGDQAAVFYDTPYARRQHEELGWRHDPGRRAKYLELALVEQHPVILAIIAAEIRRELAAGS